MSSSVAELGSALKTDELQRLVKEARIHRKPTCVRASKTSRTLGDGNGSWPCHACGTVKLVADFDVRANGSVSSYCKSCRKKKCIDYKRTLRGNASTLVCSARHRAKVKGWACNLDIDFILDKILHQQGRCAYSGVQMEMLLPHSDWRMSLERLNNAIGYVQENCVLIAAEFNTTETISRRVAMEATSGSSKWSLQKVKYFRTERLFNVDLQVLDMLIEAASIPYQSIQSPAVLTPSECQREGLFNHFRCSKCGSWKPATYFSHSRRSRTGLRSQCKQCDCKYNFARRLTLRGHAQELLNHARGRHKLGKWRGNFELNIDSVLETLRSQRGRCFYSDVPLSFAQLNVDWMMSLERLDNSWTYTRENSVLVALEFNTAVQSRTASEVFGSGQWSRRKVEHVWGSLEKSSPVELL